MARVVGTVLQIAGVFTSNPYLFYAGTAISVGDSIEQSRRQRRRDKALFNAAQKDRLEMVDRDPNQARSLAMGRVRTVEGVRRPWQSGTHLENLTLPVSFAGHQIDGFEQLYLHDTPVTLDVNGYVLTSPWLTSTDEPSFTDGTLNGSGAAVIALPSPPSGPVYAIWRTGVGKEREEGQCSVSVSVVALVAVATVTGGRPGASVRIYSNSGFNVSKVRLRTYTGGPQNIGALLASEYGGNLRTTDSYKGIALAIMDCIYDPDVFPQGRPTLTALLRGAKLYDPRKDSTVPGGSGSHRYATPSTWEWSENPALQALRYLTWEHGWAVPIDDISLADIMEAANVCDVPTVFTLRKTDGSTTTLTLPRYLCGVVISSEADHRDAMDIIFETMNGRWCWAGGLFRCRAGVKRAAVATLDEAWLFEGTDTLGERSGSPVISGANGVPRDRRVNRITGRCVDPEQRYQMLAFPAVQDAVLVAAKGPRPDDVDFEGVNNIAHAQHLGSMMIRKAMAGLRLETRCGLRALLLEPLDVLAFNLPDYGFAGNEAEIVAWRYSPGNVIGLQFEEISSGLFTVDAELRGRDPAPDSNLRKPWVVEQITGVAVTSGTAEVQDGSVLTRTTVTWDAAVGETIRRGGEIEVQFTEATEDMPDGDWPNWTEQGSATKAVIPSLMAGRFYYFLVRAIQKGPQVRGKWSSPVVLHQVAGARNAIIYRQASAPSGDVFDGDQWYDTDDGNKHYVREGGAWVSVRDSGIAQALADAADAQATADGKIATFYQTIPPTAEGVGDIWFDTDDGNKQYRWSGSAWAVADDTRIGQAISDAADAQATADGKVTTFVSASAPTADAVGDLWLDSDDGNKLYRWSGSAWVALPVGTGAIAANAATEVIVDNVDHAGAGFGTVTVQSFMHTPAVASIVEFTAKVTAANILGDAGNRIEWRVTPAGGSTVILGGSETNSTAKQELTAANAFSAAAGVELTFDLRVVRPSGNPAINLYTSYMRATVIKR